MDKKTSETSKSNVDSNETKREKDFLDGFFSLIFCVYDYLAFYALALESIVYVFKLSFFNISDCISDALQNSGTLSSQIYELCWSIGFNPESHYRFDYDDEAIFVRKSSFNQTIEQSIETFVRYREETEILLLDACQIWILFGLMLSFYYLSKMMNGFRRSLYGMIFMAFRIILICSLKLLVNGQFSFTSVSSQFDLNKLFESTVYLNTSDLFRPDLVDVIPIERLDSSIRLYNVKLETSMVTFDLINFFVYCVFGLFYYFSTLALFLYIIIKTRDLIIFLSSQSSINLMQNKFHLLDLNLKEIKIMSIKYKLFKADSTQRLDNV